MEEITLAKTEEELNAPPAPADEYDEIKSKLIAAEMFGGQHDGRHYDSVYAFMSQLKEVNKEFPEGAKMTADEYIQKQKQDFWEIDQMTSQQKIVEKANAEAKKKAKEEADKSSFIDKMHKFANSIVRKSSNSDNVTVVNRNIAINHPADKDHPDFYKTYVDGSDFLNNPNKVPAMNENVMAAIEERLIEVDMLRTETNGVLDNNYVYEDRRYNTTSDFVTQLNMVNKHREKKLKLPRLSVNEYIAEQKEDFARTDKSIAESKTKDLAK